MDRYGADEVSKWYFGVWNEPNLRSFWRGSQRDYFRLYRESALALKSVDARLRVGGPATAKNEWLDDFLEFCEVKRVPLDFVSTHHYPTDLPGPTPSDTEAVLASASRDILRQQAQDARRAVGDRPLMYTEWNSSSNARDPLHDEPYAAAFVIRAAIDAAGIVDAYAFWTFSDLFEESFLPSVPFHGGFGLLTIHGVPKPTYRVGAERVTLLVDRARAPSSVTVTVIDDEHANPKQRWIEMGMPTYLDDNKIADLESSSRPAPTPHQWRMSDQILSVELELRPYAVAAVTITW